jgi:predicted alpha/beta-fold hydrolase
MGGNVLLKWLGEQGEVGRGRGSPRRPCSPSPTTSGRLRDFSNGRRAGSAYHFLRRLRPKALDVLARFPRGTAHLDADRIRGARTFAAFDRHVTAPLHGFASAEDYYARASSLP